MTEDQPDAAERERPIDSEATAEADCTPPEYELGKGPYVHERESNW